jgi:hypothetical protein
MENGGRNFLIKFQIIVLTLCFAPVSTSVFASALPSLERDSAADYESRILEKEGDTYHIVIRFPQVVSVSLSDADREGVNAAIREFVDELSRSDIQSFIEEGIDPALDDSLGELRNELDIKFEMVDFSRRFVSIKFTRYFYGAGAAHGMSMVHGFNYDIENQSALSLSDFFEANSDYLEQISGFAIEDLKSQVLSEHPEEPEAVPLAEPWIRDGAAPSEENLGQFTFDGGALTIYFGDYQVGSGAFGLRETKIRAGDLKGLKPGWENSAGHKRVAE